MVVGGVSSLRPPRIYGEDEIFFPVTATFQHAQCSSAARKGFQPTPQSEGLQGSINRLPGPRARERRKGFTLVGPLDAAFCSMPGA